MPDTEIVNFFMVGCPRCGTTWVDAAMRGLDQVFLPQQKQTYFFDTHYDKGIDWYLENFRAADSSHTAVGEIATGYSQPVALQRLHRHFPHVKLMLAMRNPADRAYSFYQSRSVDYDWRSFREAVSQQPGILEQGLYADQIDRILELYPRDRVLFLFYEDLAVDDRAYLRSILDFLEVDSDFDSPRLGQMVQVAAFPRLRRGIRRAGGGPVLDAISRSVVGDILRRELKKRGLKRYPDMDADTWAFLREFYSEPNKRLEKLTGRDLSHWNQRTSDEQARV